MKPHGKIKKRERAGLELIEPLFTMDDSIVALQYLNPPVVYNTEIEAAPGIKFIYREAGHLLGSASIELFVDDGGDETKHLVFSGDLGTGKNQLLPTPAAIEKADFVFMESTYGGRLHKNMDKRGGENVALAIIEAMKHGALSLFLHLLWVDTQEIYLN